MEVLKVSSRSNPNSVAGAMAGVVRQVGVVEVQVIGAGALNQAIKAIAIARGYVAPSGIDLVCIPTFADIEIEGENRTAIRLTIEDRAQRVAGPGALGMSNSVTAPRADHQMPELPFRRSGSLVSGPPHVEPDAESGEPALTT